MEMLNCTFAWISVPAARTMQTAVWCSLVYEVTKELLCVMNYNTVTIKHCSVVK